MISPSGSISTLLVQPHFWIEAATWAICSGVWVLAFLGNGFSVEMCRRSGLSAGQSGIVILRWLETARGSQAQEIESCSGPGSVFPVRLGMAGPAVALAWATTLLFALGAYSSQPLAIEPTLAWNSFTTNINHRSTQR